MIRTLLARGALTLAAVSTAIAQVSVPVHVPQATYTTAQLYQPLRTFTSAEIGIAVTWAAMHKGYMVVSGGQCGGTDPAGYARLTTWQLSQAASPDVVNPSLIGTHLSDAIFKSHAMGFSGDKVQIRAGKFSIYDVSNMAAPTLTVQASGGVSTSHSTCWAGKYMYTGGEGYSTASGWIDVFDVSNPAAPVLKKSVDIPTITGFRCASVYVIGNLLVVSASLTNGIATFDLSDPTNPLLISVFRGDTGATTYTSYLSGNRLYGGGNSGNLYIYDIQNPANIQLVQVVNLPGAPRYPTVQDEYVHIGNSGNGHYQKIRVDSVPATIVADVPMPGRIETGNPHPIPEVAIPIGNLVFIGVVNGSNAGTSINNSAGWLIPHDTAPDTRPPDINAVRPQDGETNVAATSMIGVSFTDLLEGTSVNSSTVIVRPFGGSAIAGIYSDMNGIVNFTPSVALVANTTYEVVVPAGGVSDTQGNAVVGDHVYRFSTGASVDTTGAGLVLHYPFDETSGTVADDTAGTNNGTLTNFPPTPSPWSQGLVGRSALTLDGVADNIITSSLDVGSTLSFSTWVRVNSGNTGLETIACNSLGGSTTAGFRFFVYGSAHATTPGRITFETGNGTVGSAAYTAINVMPFDQWVHLGVTVDRTGGVGHIYVNGTDSTASSSVNTGFNTIAALTIGRMGTSYALGGNLDDFRLYNRVLTSADFKQLIYLCGNPVGKWCFNSSTANDAPDGLPVALSTTGVTYNTADSAEGAASLSLDGTSGYATAPSTNLGNGFAVAAWVKVTSGTSTLETIAANSNSGLNTAGWRLYATGSTNATPGRLILETGNGTSGIQVQTANNTLPYDTWAHIAVMIDRTSGQALIYVNGVDQTPAGTARTDFITTGPIQFGRMADNLNLFKGSIDDIRIYPRLLTDTEIRVLAVGKLLAYWGFDSTGNDGSGFGRAATLQNGAGYTTTCVRGTDSLNLDGLNSDATVAAFDVGNTFSISMWARLTTSAASSRTLLTNSPGGSATNGFRLFVNSWTSADGRIIFETGNGTLGASAGTATGVFQINQWNHIAIVVNRTAGTANIYYNRQLVSTSNTIRPDFGTNLAFYIGRLVTSAPFQGQIDDLRIYNKLLSNTDIGALGDGSSSLPPTISSLASSSPAATDGTALTFTATASDLTVGLSLSYRFDFGDGNSTSWTPNGVTNHTYSIPGRYVVTAFVSNGISTVSTTTTQIVYNPPTATAPSISAEMAYDSSRNKVWVVVPDGNDDDNNVGTPPQGVVVRFDGITRTVDTRVNLGANSEPAALAIRPGNTEVWVANKRAGTVTIVDANTTGILTTLNMGRGSLPVGICFAPDGSAAFVACEGSEGVLKFDPATRTQTGVVDTGAAPRGLACTSDSLRLLVSRFRSPDTAGQVWEYSPAAIVLTGNATPVRTFSLNADTTTVDGEGHARGVPNYLSQVVISPDGMKAWLPAKKDNIFRGTYRDGQPLGHNNTVRSLVGQLSLITNAEISANRIDLNHTGFTVAGCFSPHGDLYFGAEIGNEAVAVIDANTRNTLPAISTATGASVLGYAPSGLCMSPDGSKLYVHNFLERTVRVFNVSALTAGTSTGVPPLLGTVNLITTEPLTATILQGKKVFYNSMDPRIASEGYIACASCHLGGDHDGRVWDITNLGEGLRNTIDLRGHAGMANGELHWSSNFNEVQDFDIQIRNLNGGSGLIVGTPYPPNGTTNVGRSADLDALAAYVTSLNVYPPSPFRNADGSMTASATSGAALFVSQACNTCHSGTYLTDSTTNIFTGLVVHDIGTMTTASGQRLGGTLTGLDTPTLRGIWTTAPYLHRGQAADLPSVFNTTNAPASTAHARFRELNATQQQQLLDYLNEQE